MNGSMDKYLELYTNIYPVENAKSRDGIQWEGLCPFHDDHNNSFGYRTDSGVCNCFVGCISGGAFDYAVKRGMAEKEARVYFNGHDDNWSSSPPPPKILVNMDTLQKDVDRFIVRRLNNPHLIPKIWSEKVLGDLGVGLDDNNNLVFPYYDYDGNLRGYKVHKIETKGGVKNHWYPMHLLGLYDHDKPLYIVAGEKDVITLLSRGLQAISVTTGETSIPKKKKDTIDLIKYYNEDIVICYDHDDTGYKGQRKVGEFIVEELPSHQVMISKWRKDLQKGYDVTDAFMHSSTGENFFDAIYNGEELQKPKKKGIYAIGIKNFMKKDYTKTDPIIKNILYRNHISIIGGDTGCMKSWLAMQVACSVASGIDFLGYFKATPQKCMLIQFENENTDMQDRFKDMIAYFNKIYGSDEWQDNLVIVPKDDEGVLFVNMWDEVEKVMAENDWHNAVIIVDNLYSSTDRDLKNTEDITDVLRQVDSIKRKFQSSILLIAHTNKIDVNVKDLKIDQLQGNKTLVSQVSNVIMLGKSSISNDIKIMKFVKCRSDENRDLEEIPFKIHWDDENAIFTKGAIIKDISIHFLPMKKRWELEEVKHLYKSMKVRTWFNRELLREHLSDANKGMNTTKESNLLNRLVSWGFLKKGEHNEWIFIKHEIEELD